MTSEPHPAAGRRAFLKALGLAAGAPALAGLAGCAALRGSRPAGHVVVVGGGYGGATAAKYLRMWSQGRVAVTLIERDEGFVSCPMSNLVIGGVRRMAEISSDYRELASAWGVRVLHDEALAIDPGKREVRLANHGRLAYDRVVVSPGIDFLADEVAGLAGNEQRLPHAWKAGAQTALLRGQLETMRDGGVFAICIPRAPYRCPPAPYERACLVAHYFATRKPRSKVLVLDANDEIQSKKALFLAAFQGPYKDIIEYRPDNALREVDAARRVATLDFDTVRADVLNVIPPMRAGRLVDSLGVELINGRWVDVDWLTLEAKGAPGVHVLGDALFPAPTMPKSGHMANQQAKVAAAAILDLLAGSPPNPEPVVVNTCYSFVDAKNAMHVASVHRYDAARKTFLPVAGAGGLSPAANELEGKYAWAWARNIWADMLA
jgi:sulfite dehydrogenase